MTIDDTQDNTKLTSLFAAESSVSLVGVALVFDLHVSWLAQEVVSELCWFLVFLDLSFSPSIAHSFAGACESLRLLVDCVVCIHEVSKPNHNESSGGHLRFGSPCLERGIFFVLRAMAIGKGRRRTPWWICSLLNLFHNYIILCFPTACRQLRYKESRNAEPDHGK